MIKEKVHEIGSTVPSLAAAFLLAGIRVTAVTDFYVVTRRSYSR
jgi:hypothetical protein